MNSPKANWRVIVVTVIAVTFLGFSIFNINIVNFQHLIGYSRNIQHHSGFGDNVAGDKIINHNPPLPQPTLDYSVVKPINIPLKDGRFKTKFRATISSSLPIIRGVKVKHPTFCSTEELGGGPVIDGAVTTFETNLHIVCTANFLIDEELLKRDDLFTLVTK